MGFRECVGGCTLAGCHDRQRCMRDEAERREHADAAKHGEQRSVEAWTVVDDAVKALAAVAADDRAWEELGARTGDQTKVNAASRVLRAARDRLL